MNYFTGLAKSYIDSDAKLYEEVTEGAKAAMVEHWGNVSDAAFDFGYTLENGIKNTVVKKLSIIPETENLLSELMSAAIREIDFHLIAREYIEWAAHLLKGAGKLTPWNY